MSSTARVARTRGESSSAGPPARSHLVQLYEDDEFLCEVVTDFLLSGARLNERLVVVAIEDHRDQLLRRLGSRGWNVEDALRTGALTLVDAVDALASLHVGDQLDPARITALLVDVLQLEPGSQASPMRARVYAEVAGLLWEASRLEESAQLEAEWNRLADLHDFSLFCSYRITQNDRDAARDVSSLCKLQTVTLPSEHGSSLGRFEDRVRHLFMLEQQVRDLQEKLIISAQTEAGLRKTLDSMTALRLATTGIVRDSVQCRATIRPPR